MPDDEKITNLQRELLVKFIANEHGLPVYADRDGKAYLEVGGSIGVNVPLDDERLVLMAKEVVAFYEYKLRTTKTVLHDILFPETQ